MKRTECILFVIIITTSLMFINCGKKMYPYFWKTSINSSTVFFLGSWEAVSANDAKDIYPFADEIYQAFKNSDKVFFDYSDFPGSKTNPDPEKKNLLTYEEGRSLRDYLREEDIDKLAAFWKTNKMVFSKEGIVIFRPWYIMQANDRLLRRRMGDKTELEIESHFRGRVTDRHQVIGLENPTAESDFLSQLPDVLFAGGILSVLNKELKEIEEKVRKKKNLFLSGEYEKVEDFEYFYADQAEKRVLKALKKLTLDRNKRWADKILQNLEPGKTCFVVIDIKHFYGKGNIFEYFKKLGADFLKE